MKKIIFPFILLAFVLTSCYPPRIIYSIEDVQPSCQEDSIEAQLMKGSTYTTGGLSISLHLYLEILNNKEDCIFIEKNSTLELRTDSAVLKYKISPDSLNYQLNKNEKKLLYLYFRATDFDHITYKTVDWPSIWSFRTRNQKAPQHKIYLFLDLQDESSKKIEKCIILKPTGTKRMKYEKPPF
jgi:hypothetical protein